MSWRTGALLREAALNLGSGYIRLAVAAGTVFAALLSLALLELRDAADLLDFQRDYAAAGGYVVVVAAAEGGQVDAARCEALNASTSVLAAGSVGEPELASFATAPGLLFQSAEATQGAFAVWDPRRRVPSAQDGSGAVAGSALASELGLRAGGYVQPEGREPLPVLAVLDTEERNPQVSRWLLSPVAPAGVASRCWVEFDRRSYGAGLGLLGAWFAEGDQPPVVTPYRRADEFARDPEAEFASRPQRLGWALASAVIVAMAWLMTWFRRSELGLYLALGTPRSGAVFLLAAEAWLLVLPAATAAYVYGLALGHALGWDPGMDEALLAARTLGSAALLALVVMPLAPLVLVRGTIADLLKDR